MSLTTSVSRTLAIAGLLAVSSAWAITPSDLANRLSRNEGVLVIDARPAAAYGEGHVPGAINIPLSLLPHKPIPSSGLVVVYGDGQGLVDDQQALAVVKGKPGVKAEVLEGGYAAWLAQTRLSTQGAGVSTEKLPAMTYNQLVSGSTTDVVLVDLRGPAAPASAATKAAASKNKQTRAAAAEASTDVVGDLGRKLGIPVLAANANAGASAKATTARAMADGKSGSSALSAKLSIALPSDPNTLLVLVADDEAAATEIARQLRAAGHYRFSVLIGGTESIRHEGRQGLGRMDGSARSARD